jgi:hypothetical protein
MPCSTYIKDSENTFWTIYIFRFVDISSVFIQYIVMDHKNIKYYLALLISVFLFSCVNTKKFDIVFLYQKQVVYAGRVDSNGRKILLIDSLTKPCIVKITKRDSFIAIAKYSGDL